MAKHHPTPKAKKAYVNLIRKSYVRTQKVLKAHGEIDEKGNLKKK